MKFINYIINESNKIEDIVYLLEKNCIKFIKELKGNFLYRGSYKKISNDISEFESRIKVGRKPKDSDPRIHEGLNKAFEKKFGWKVRNGVFTSFKSSTAREYGEPYLFYPIGNYEYCYSEEYDDLYVNIHNELIDRARLDIYGEYNKVYGYDKKGEWIIRSYWDYNDYYSISFKKLIDITRKYDLDYNKLSNSLKENFKEKIIYSNYSIKLDDDDTEKLKDNDYFSEKKEPFFIVWKPEKEFYDYFNVEFLNYDNFDFSDIVSQYRNDNIFSMVYRNNEISFKCNRYYLVDIDYRNEIENYFEDKI